MERLVSIINPKGSAAAAERPRPFSSYADVTNIVLLGDAGAGKTHLFQDSALVGGRFLTARTFMSTPQLPPGETLFIDGLDEKRAGRADRDTVDAMVGKLFAATAAKVRISCRVADWLGDTDIAALRPYFDASGEPVLLLLNRLSADEQVAILLGRSLSRAEAVAFLSEAQRRMLDEFLTNPQNLVMLADVVVKGGAWPTTRRELFELSTDLMLREANKDRARTGGGIYTTAELRPSAGAACAARLISDVAGIGLAEVEESPDYPSYRTLTTSLPEKTLAALERRVFTSASASEAVDYAHRTLAEYLAAEWLAGRVRSGLPLGRVLALIGIDGHPATELRGLHAWLAVHMPEYADRLIDADPYGVLTYADAASLSQQACRHLLAALGRAAEDDPWFRSGRWGAPTIAALARRDMLAEFAAILASDDSGFALRSLVMEAAALGPPLPELNEALSRVLTNTARPYAERLYALDALTRNGGDGKERVRTAFASLTGALNEVRLRAHVITELYGDGYGPADIVALIGELAAGDPTHSATTILFSLEKIPTTDLELVLDALPREPVARFRERHRGEREVERYVARLLVRALRELPQIEPARALDWLSARMAFVNGSRADSDDLQAALTAKPELFGGIVDAYLERVPIDDQRWFHLSRFRQTVLHTIPTPVMLRHTLSAKAKAEPGSARELFLYEAAFTMLFSLKPGEINGALDELISLADDRQDLQQICDASLVCPIPDYYFEREPAEPGQTLEEVRERFAADAPTIREGLHLGGLNYAAKLYFARFSDSDEELAPRDRLAVVLDRPNADAAIEGFKAALARQTLPTLAEVLHLRRQQQVREWWFALSAGLEELSTSGEGFSGLTNDFLMAMIAFDDANPNHQEIDGSIRTLVPSWRKELLSTRPELVHEAFLAVARVGLGGAAHRADGLRELLTNEAFFAWRRETALNLLDEFPNASPFSLDDLLGALIGDAASRDRLLDIADKALGGLLEDAQRDQWLASAYLLSPERYASDLEARTAHQPKIVFALRDRLKIRDREGDGLQKPALPQLEFLARLVGRCYPRTGHPVGAVWTAEDNAWDATDFCRRLISEISSHPSASATLALQRLEAETQLESYRSEIRHALANQQQRRRDFEYERPDWKRTIAALEGGPPATVADLHALLVDQLRDVARNIAHANTDIFKAFWNVDSYARPTNPRPEDACRDVLVTLLRPAVAPLGIVVEPEGHMVSDKRADITVSMPGRKIPVELKRDFHSELWKASERQLEQLYAHDPEARGFGIYGVFWFGDKRGPPIPPHPAGLQRPGSSQELEDMLWAVIPDDHKSRTAVIVIDVSRS